MGSVAFVGCSFFAGVGLDQNAAKSENLWVNICQRNFTPFKKLKLINGSVGGASNADIFKNSLFLLTTNSDLKYLICGWTSVPRFNFNTGFELYETEASLNVNHNVVKGPLTKSEKVVTSNYIQNLSYRVGCLMNIQFEIADLIKYINILNKVAKDNNVKLINVNAICPWDYGFFNQKTKPFLPSDLTPFTQKEILKVDTRSDDEIYKLYELQHKMYSDAGGILEHTWVNLYRSHQQMAVDLGIDGVHPGPKSNQLFFENFINSDIVNNI